jgi:hypothetical protein
MYLEELRQTTGIVTRLFLLEVIQSLVLSNRKEFIPLWQLFICLNFFLRLLGLTLSYFLSFFSFTHGKLLFRQFNVLHWYMTGSLRLYLVCVCECGVRLEVNAIRMAGIAVYFAAFRMQG